MWFEECVWKRVYRWQSDATTVVAWDLAHICVDVLCFVVEDEMKQNLNEIKTYIEEQNTDREDLTELKMLLQEMKSNQSYANMIAKDRDDRANEIDGLLQGIQSAIDRHLEAVAVGVAQMGVDMSEVKEATMATANTMLNTADSIGELDQKMDVLLRQTSPRSVHSGSLSARLSVGSGIDMTGCEDKIESNAGKELWVSIAGSRVSGAPSM